MPEPFDADNDLDIVTVAHRDHNYRLMLEMFARVLAHHPDRVKVIPVDNRVDNLGFAKGCNVGARHGNAPIIGFLNPDTIINGPFAGEVIAVLTEPGVVITGCRFGKPADELRVWGVTDWVVGAVMFVRRDWWEAVGGFDERFFLYFEETDLIRRAESAGLRAQSIILPLHHQSPSDDPPEEALLKQRAFERSAQLYRQKWRHS